ncbi:MAG: ATP-dependent Clp protease adaptor ClpS [Planctomycetota bacterium]
MSEGCNTFEPSAMDQAGSDGTGWDESGFGPGLGFGFGSSPEGGAGSMVVRPRVRPVPESEREQPVPWRVILLDDDDHTYEYVMRMMQTIFGVSIERAYELAKTVDADGRAVCMTTHRELAELKAEQIHSFGPDPLMQRSAGPMSAVIEPAECGGDDDAADRNDC